MLYTATKTGGARDDVGSEIASVWVLNHGERRVRVAAMKKMVPAANPDAYVAALDGWRRDCVAAIRAAVLGAAKLEEVVKWGHLVYLTEGPVLLIRAEESRVVFGFWRGKRLRAIDPRMKPGGKYEMASIELREGDSIDSKTVRRLTREAVKLNVELGNPTLAAKR
jgi:hypothetical protein